jgi:hypothetical protein
MPNKKNSTIEPADLLTKEELDERVAQTIRYLDEAMKLWPGLRRMTEAERKNSPGRALGVVTEPLRQLFAVLTPKKGQPRPAIAKAFDVLGAKDGGKDPEVFEAELLDLRLYRAQAQQKIVDKLDAFSRHMADDVLDLGEQVMGPGLLALQLARTVAAASAEYASALAPVLDAFRGLTKNARKARSEKANGAKPVAKPADK